MVKSPKLNLKGKNKHTGSGAKASKANWLARAAPSLVNKFWVCATSQRAAGPLTTCWTGMGCGAMGAGLHCVVDMVLFCQFCPPVSFFSPGWLQCISGLRAFSRRLAGQR